MCEEGGRALVSGATGKKTDLLNKMADIENMSFSRFNNSEYLWNGNIRLNFSNFSCRGWLAMMIILTLRR